MARRSTRGTVTPYEAWMPFIQLSLSGAEMAVAAAQVIGHRTWMMARAGNTPNVAECREFRNMGSEKVDAMTHSLFAMSRLWPGFSRQLQTLSGQQWELANATVAVCSARSPGDLATAQQRYWQAFMGTGEATMNIWLGAVGMAQGGLAPIHSRATANAKRLGLARLGGGGF